MWKYRVKWQKHKLWAKVSFLFTLTSAVPTPSPLRWSVNSTALCVLSVCSPAALYQRGSVSPELYMSPQPSLVLWVITILVDNFGTHLKNSLDLKFYGPLLNIYFCSLNFLEDINLLIYDLIYFIRSGMFHSIIFLIVALSSMHL